MAKVEPRGHFGAWAFLTGLVLLLLLSAAPALANGNYSHLWIAKDSLARLEAGELRDLLSRPEVQLMVHNGAIFPDGGYAVGDGYGEISHWEPFHLAYLEWIRANFSPPWSAEAAEHIAFLMGMVAHGMADQLFDGLYLERHVHYDPPVSNPPLFGVDGATDACFAASHGTMEVPSTWIPAANLAPLYPGVAGHQVSPATLELGQSLVVVAIMAANDAVSDQKKIDEYNVLYPFACGNQDDLTIPGSPGTHAPVIAGYWQVLWGRLHGESGFEQALVGTLFDGGEPWNQTLDHGLPESWVSFVSPRGLKKSTVGEESVLVRCGDPAAPHPVSAHLYYGQNSHLVNLRPQIDWPAESDCLVTISAPLESWDGAVLAGERSFAFSTRSGPPDMTEDVQAQEADERSDSSGGCVAGPGTTSSRRIGWLLVGLTALFAVRRRARSLKP